MLAPSRASRLGTRRARSVCIGGTAFIVLHAHLAADRGQRLDETGGAAGGCDVSLRWPGEPPTAGETGRGLPLIHPF